ncbi:MAG: UDP-N-acetylmuramoyl-L-alanyl-D-glutamate--2,6-diaminopimelate ligase [Acidimicrobiia bacterium]|nr:UDP-N-acetylmuramoyl-L-alanyl-D-glutamate--2,6-diaminopimelate ligase [Acidimicrobiia bacterium]
MRNTLPITLAEIAHRLDGELSGNGAVALHDVTHDSSSAGPGSLFVAVPGHNRDGHRFIDQAVDRGAGAALVEEYVLSASIPQLKVADTRRVLGVVASWVHGDPSDDLEIIGVTGTNGKTTVTVMLEAIAEAAGRPFGRIGTLGVNINGKTQPQALTTPEGSDLQRTLKKMVDGGVSMVAMEVSSHSLALHRVEGTSFHVAAFTNLSQDHLDFHGTMENYYGAKARLFNGHSSAYVVDVTSSAGRRLADSLSDQVVTVGRGSGHDVAIFRPEANLFAARFRCEIAGRSLSLEIKPGGLHNIHNAALAAACAVEVGIGTEDIIQGLASVKRVRGRLDPVDLGQTFGVLVDYAHSPEAVESVISTAKSHAQGRVIVVVGAAGERDPTKRPLLGAAAAEADLAVITSDNPRREDPDTLVKQVLEGTGGGSAQVLAEVDREKAIRLAIDQAESGDTVLILGKGHETYQDFGERVISFDDRAIAADHLRRRRSARISTEGGRG